jgi:hypothetical protein
MQALLQPPPPSLARRAASAVVLALVATAVVAVLGARPAWAEVQDCADWANPISLTTNVDPSPAYFLLNSSQTGYRGFCLPQGTAIHLQSNSCITGADNHWYVFERFNITNGATGDPSPGVITARDYWFNLGGTPIQVDASFREAGVTDWLSCLGA